MSYCKEEGKDRIIFSTKDDLLKPIDPDIQKILDVEIEEEGPIKANGEINWNCPCMGSTVSGPCGYEFRETFSCFRNSQEAGEDPVDKCHEQFAALHNCFERFPELYQKKREEGEEEDEEEDFAMDAPDSTLASRPPLSAQDSHIPEHRPRD